MLQTVVWGSSNLGIARVVCLHCLGEGWEPVTGWTEVGGAGRKGIKPWAPTVFQALLAYNQTAYNPGGQQFP